MVVIDCNMKSLLELIDKNKEFNSGAESIIFDYNGNSVLKVRRRVLEDIEDYDTGHIKSLVENIIDKQRYIKNTDLPYGMVTLNGKFIGSLSRKVKAYYELNEYFYRTDNINYLRLIKKVLENNKELIDNDIVNIDLGESNILIDTHENINFVDIDSDFTTINPITKAQSKYIVTNYFILLYNFINKLVVNDRISIINELDSIDDYRKFDKYIDELIKTNTIVKAKRLIH